MSQLPASSGAIELIDHLAGNKSVAAVIEEGLLETHVDEWYTQWRPIYDQIRATKARKEWPQSAHWDWSQKLAAASNLAAYRGFAVRCEGSLQGMMLAKLADPRYVARADGAKGKPLVYVDYLETAPWNQRWYPAKRFARVGVNLITQAVSLSESEEFAGRIGLHALPDSEAFYAGIGMEDFGRDESHPQRLRYFEFTAAGLARAFDER